MQAYDYVTSTGALVRIAEEIAASPRSALDLETTALDPRAGKIRLCSVNTGKRVYVIDLFKTGGFGPVKQAIADTDGVIAGQNLKFDQKWLLWHEDVEIKRPFDSFRASNVLHNGHDYAAHDLYSLYRRELNLSPEAPDLGASNWSGELTKDQIDYAAEDVFHLPAIRESLIPKLQAAGLVRIAQIEFQAILPEAAIELNGFYLDQEKWLHLAKLNEARKRASEAYLLQEMPSPHAQMALPGLEPDKKYRFNLESPEQVLKSFRKMGLRQKVRVEGTKEWQVVPLQDTTEMTLAMLASQFPIVSKFIEYRGYAQRVKSFGEEYLKHVSPFDKRIHTEFWPYTGAGRYASSSPNLQQIPRDKDFRECFAAEQGNLLAIADYSNIEMRLVAEISGDELLIQIFVDDRDAHYATASLLAGVPESQVTKAQRQQAKPVNFGFIYGMQAPRLVLYARANYGVTLTEKQAWDFRRKFFDAYVGIEHWHERVIRDGARMKESRTIWGRRRYLDPETAHNEFFNSPVQGSGADGLKRSLPLVYNRMKKLSGGKVLLAKGARCGLVHMVHDETVIEHRDEGPEFAAEVQKNLEDGMVEGMAPMMRRVPTKCEAGGGPSWASKS